MKKFSLYVILIASVLMVGCNKKRYEPAFPEEDAWIYDYTLPVPIKFYIGQDSPATKAQINQWSDMTGEIGIFGYDKYNTGQLSFDKNLLSNEAATVTMDNVDLTKGEIAFTSGRKFYPMDDIKTCWNFVGYYPKVPDEDLIFTNAINRAYAAKYTITGKEDIMWAIDSVQATSPYIDDGFNASYLRLNPTSQPELNFEHKLAALKFLVEYVESSEEAAQGISITVKSVKIKDQTVTKTVGEETQEVSQGGIRTDLYMILYANKLYTNHKVGSLVDLSSVAGVTPTYSPLTLESEIEGDISNYTNASPGEICTFMIPPVAEKVKLDIVFTINVASTADNPEFEAYDSEIEFSVTSNSGLAANKEYRVQVQIWNPETIQINAKLTPWDPSGNTTINTGTSTDNSYEFD